MNKSNPSTLSDFLKNSTTSDNGVIYVQLDKSEIFQNYRNLVADAQRILHGLRKLGVMPQDKVVLQIESHQDFICAFWGCILGGFVPVPVTSLAYNPKETNEITDKLAYTLEMLGHPWLIADPHVIVHFPETRRSTVATLLENEQDTHWHISHPQDPAVIILTSGSTGLPKGVVLTHHNLISQALGSIILNGYRSQDISLNWIPMDHVASLFYFHVRDIILRSRQIHFPLTLFLEEPLFWLELISKHNVTIAFGPNFAFALINAQHRILAERSYDLSSMRFFLNGAESIVAKTARRFLQLLAPHGLAPNVMTPSWGMAEVSSGVTFSHRFSPEHVTDDDLFVEVGTPIPGTALRIVDTDDMLVPDGEIGALQVKGTTVMPGYFQNEKANHESFTKDGWFRTGDLGFFKNGRLTITGREKEVIIICGNNYYCHDIEAATDEIDGVVPGFTAACAVRKKGAETDQIALFFCPSHSKNLPRIKQDIRKNVLRLVGIPVDFLVPVAKADIPKTAIGKIQRRLLAKRFETGQFTTWD